MKWRLDGTCATAEAPPGLFYPDDRYDHGTPEYEHLKGEVTAAYCIGCPVRLRCLTHAMTLPERYGLWAGTDEADRKAARKNRQTPAELLAQLEAAEVPPLEETA